jgi:hypothetical protein
MRPIRPAVVSPKTFASIHHANSMSPSISNLRSMPPTVTTGMGAGRAPAGVSCAGPRLGRLRLVTFAGDVTSAPVLPCRRSTDCLGPAQRTSLSSRVSAALTLSEISELYSAASRPCVTRLWQLGQTEGAAATARS